MPFCATPHARTLYIATLRKAVCVYFSSMIARGIGQLARFGSLCCVLCVVVCACVCCGVCAWCVQGSITYQLSSACILTRKCHSEKATNWTLCIPWMESGSDMTWSITERTPSAYMSVILSASHCRSCDNHVIGCMVTWLASMETVCAESSYITDTDPSNTWTAKRKYGYHRFVCAVYVIIAHIHTNCRYTTYMTMTINSVRNSAG